MPDHAIGSPESSEETPPGGGRGRRAPRAGGRRRSWMARMARRLPSLGLLLAFLIWAAWFAITREAFIRGFVLPKLFGDQYARTLTVGHTRLSVFPPALVARDVRLFDPDPAPGANAQALRIHSITLRGRWLPVRELRLDEVDVFGVQANLSRDARGEWNLERAWRELERSAGPRPVRLEAFRRDAPNPFRLYAGQWRVEDLRLRVQDTSGGPGREWAAEFEAPQAVLLGREGQARMDVTAALPVRIEGYARLLGAEPSPWYPLGMEIRLTNPLRPRFLGVNARMELKPSLARLGRRESNEPLGAPEAIPLPPWDEITRQAPSLIEARATLARDLREPLDISNILIQFNDRRASRPLLQISEGRVDPVARRFEASVRMETSLASAAAFLEDTDYPPLQRFAGALRERPEWRPLLSPAGANRARLTLEGRAALSGSTSSQNASAAASAAAAAPEILRFDTRARLDDTPLSLLELRPEAIGGDSLSAHAALAGEVTLNRSLSTTLSRAELTLFHPGGAATTTPAPAGEKKPADALAPGQTDRILARISLAGGPQRFRLRNLRARLAASATSLPSPGAGASAPGEEFRFPADWARRIPPAAWRARQALRALGDPAGRWDVELRRARLAELPWLRQLKPSPESAPPDGFLEGAAQLWLFETDRLARISGNFRFQNLRAADSPLAPESAPGARLALDCAWSHRSLVLERLTSSWVWPDGGVNQWWLRDSSLDLATGRGQFSLGAEGVDARALALLGDLGGPAAVEWLARRHGLLALLDLDPGRAEPEGGRLEFSCSGRMTGLPREAILEMDLTGRAENFSPGRRAGVPPENARDYEAELRFSGRQAGNSGLWSVDEFSLRLNDSGSARFRLEVLALERGRARIPPGWLDTFASDLGQALRAAASAPPAREEAPESATAPLEAWRAQRLLLEILRLIARQHVEVEMPWSVIAGGVKLGGFAGPLFWLGAPAQSGGADMAVIFEPLESGGALADDPPSTSTAAAHRDLRWSARIAGRGATLTHGAQAPAMEMAASGILNSERVEANDWQAAWPGGHSSARGRFEFATGRWSAETSVDTDAGRRPLEFEAPSDSPLSEAIRWIRRSPAGALMELADPRPAATRLAWRAEQDSPGAPLRLRIESLARPLVFFSTSPEPALLRVIENLEFQNARRATLRDFRGTLSADGLASPLLTFAMEGEPLDLRAALGESALWLDSRDSTTATVALRVEGDAGALLERFGAPALPPLLLWNARGRFEAAGRFPLGRTGASEGRFDAKGRVWTSDAAARKPVGAPAEFAFEARMSARPGEVRLERLEAEPAAAPFLFRRLTASAIRREAKPGEEDFRLDAALEGARGEFFRPIRHPLRPWLLASGALTDLSVSRRLRDRGRRVEEEARLEARGAALCPAALPGAGRATSAAEPWAPIHEPLRMELATAAAWDTFTSTLLVNRLEFTIRPEDAPPTASLARASLSAPMRVELGRLALAAADPRTTAPCELAWSLGPLDAGRWGAAFWPLLSRRLLPAGRVEAAGSLRAGQAAPGREDARLTGRFRLAPLRFFSTAPGGGEEGEGPPLEAAGEFDLSLRLGALSVESLRLEAPNAAPGAPPDDLRIEGALFTEHSGWRPELRVNAAYLDLAKYIRFFAYCSRAGEREAAAASAAQAPPPLNPPRAQTAAHPLLRPDLVRNSRLRVEAKELRAGGLDWRQVTALLLISRGRMRLGPAQARLGDGLVALEGDGALSAAGEGSSRWTLNARLIRVPVEPLARAFVDAPGFEAQGALDGSARLAGEGWSRAALARAFKGWADLEWSEGRLRLAGGRLPLAEAPGPVRARLRCEARDNHLDFSLASHPEDPQKEIRLRGYVKGLASGNPRLSALLALGWRTQVGPRPPRETGRLEPDPQLLVGKVWRLEGPLAGPEPVRARLETWEY